MHAPVWQVQDSLASLCLTRLRANLNLSRPGDGLTNLVLDGSTLAGTALFQIGQESLGDLSLAPRDAAHLDHYVRGTDLVATYEETASRRLRAQLYWRTPCRPLDDTVVAVELIASVQTSLLEGNPLLTVQCTLPAAEVLRLRHASDVRFDPLAPGHATEYDFSRREPCCFLVRPAGASWSYAEMVHPLDAQATHVELDAVNRSTSNTRDASGSVRLRHRLFQERIEKGVILRARVWGLFLTRESDTSAAAAHYQSFAAEEPPLST